MKKCFAYLVGIIMAISCCIFATKQYDRSNVEIVNAAEVSDGNYELIGNTYYIKSQSGFKMFLDHMENENDPTLSYELQTDIEYDRYDKNRPDPIENFYGTFDGNGHTISGLSMFCKYNYGTITNVEFTNVNTKLVDRSVSTRPYAVYEHTYMNGGSVTTMPYYCVGGIVGVNMKGAKVFFCGVVNSAVRLKLDIGNTNYWDDEHYACVGGIVGLNFGHVAASYTINNSISTYTSDTYSYAGGSGPTNNCVGGIVGYLGGRFNQSSRAQSVIAQCFAVKNSLSARGFRTWEDTIYSTILVAHPDYPLEQSTKGCGGIVGASFYEWFYRAAGMPFLIPADAWLVTRCYSDYQFNGASDAPICNYIINQNVWFNEKINTSDYAGGIFSISQRTEYPNFYLWGCCGPESVMYKDANLIECITSENMVPAAEGDNRRLVWDAKILLTSDIMDNYGEVDCAGKFVYPSSTNDHYGYPYVGVITNVTLQYYAKQSDFQNTMTDLDVVKYNEISDTSLNSPAYSNLHSLESITSGGKTYQLKGLKAKSGKSANANSWIGDVATYDGSKFTLTGDYSLELAKKYPYIYPSYSVPSIKVNFKYQNNGYNQSAYSSLGKESIPDIIVSGIGTITNGSNTLTKTYDMANGDREFTIDLDGEFTSESIVARYGETGKHWYYVGLSISKTNSSTSYGTMQYKLVNPTTNANHSRVPNSIDQLYSICGGTNGKISISNIAGLPNGFYGDVEFDVDIFLYKKVCLNVAKDYKSVGDSAACKLYYYTLEGLPEGNPFLWSENGIVGPCVSSRYITPNTYASAYSDEGKPTDGIYFVSYGTSCTISSSAATNAKKVFEPNLSFADDSVPLFGIEDVNAFCGYGGFYYNTFGNSANPEIWLFGKPVKRTGTFTYKIDLRSNTYLDRLSGSTETVTVSGKISRIALSVVIGDTTELYYIDYCIPSGEVRVGLTKSYDDRVESLSDPFEFSKSMEISISAPDTNYSYWRMTIKVDNTMVVENGKIQLPVSDQTFDDITSVTFNIDGCYKNKNTGYNHFLAIANSSGELSESLISNVRTTEYIDARRVVDTTTNSRRTSFGEGKLATKWELDSIEQDEHLYITELTKLTLDNSAVGASNQTMYVANGTDVYTTPYIPSGVRSYVYNTPVGAFDVFEPTVFKIRNNEIEFCDHSDSETPHFYYDGVFSYEFPTATLLARSYKFYYVEYVGDGINGPTGFTLNSSNSSIWAEERGDNDEIYYEYLNKSLPFGSSLTRNVPSSATTQSKYIFVGWKFTTSLTTPSVGDLSVDLQSGGNNQSTAIFSSTSFLSGLDPDNSEYYIHEIWKSASTIAPTVTLKYIVYIYKDGVDSSETEPYQITYQYNSTTKKYVPSSSYINAPSVSGYTFKEWGIINSSSNVYGYLRYVSSGSTAPSLALNEITVDQYNEALTKTLGVTANYSKSSTQPNTRTVRLYITNYVNGKDVGSKTYTITYQMNDHFEYVATSHQYFTADTISGARFSSWTWPSNTYQNQFKKAFRTNSTVEGIFNDTTSTFYPNIISSVAMGDNALQNEYFINATYQKADGFKIKFNYYDTDGTYYSTENISFSLRTTFYSAYYSSSDKGFPPFKTLNNTKLQFDHLEVVNTPTASNGVTDNCKYIYTNNGQSLVVYNYLALDLDTFITNYKNSEGLICGNDGQPCVVNVYYKSFNGLGLTFIYIDKSDNSETARETEIYIQGTTFVVNSVPRSLYTYPEFVPRVVLVDYPNGLTYADVHYRIQTYGEYEDGIGSDGEVSYETGFGVDINDSIDGYYEEEIYVYYFDDYDTYYYDATINIINVDKNGNPIDKNGNPTNAPGILRTINFSYKEYYELITANDYYNTAINPDEIKGYTFNYWTGIGEQNLNNSTTSIVKLTEASGNGWMNATIADSSAFANFEGPIQYTLYAHYISDSVTVTVNVNVANVDGTTNTLTTTYNLHKKSGTNTETDWYMPKDMDSDSYVYFTDVIKKVGFNSYGYSYIDGSSNYSSLVYVALDHLSIEYYTGDITGKEITINLNYQQDATLIIVHYVDSNGNDLGKTEQWIFEYTTSGFNTSLSDKFSTNLTNYVFNKFTIVSCKTLNDVNADYTKFLVANGNSYSTVASTDAKGGYKITINAEFTRIGKTTLYVKYEDESGASVKGGEEYTLTFLTGDMDGNNIYLGNSIVAPELANFTFTGWDVGEFTDLFSISSKTLTINTSYTSSQYPTEITVIAKYKKAYITITVEERDSNSNSIGTIKYIYWYSTDKNASDKMTIANSNNIYVGDTIEAPNVAEYVFTGWNLNENTDYFTAYSGGRTLTLKQPTGNATDITIYAEYKDNNSSREVEITIKAMNGNNELERKSTSFTFYYNTTKGYSNGYSLNETIKLADINALFEYDYYNVNGKYKTGNETLQNMETNLSVGVTSPNDTEITLSNSDISEIVIDYEITNSGNVTYNITQNIKESDAYTRVIDTTKEFNYTINSTSNPFLNQTLITKEIPGCKLTDYSFDWSEGDRNFSELYYDSDDKITTATSFPNNCFGDYVIDIVLNYEANVITVTFEYKDKNAGASPLKTSTAKIYYNHYIGEGKDGEILKANSTISPETINNYSFLNWSDLNINASKAFTLSSDKQTLKVRSNLDNLSFKRNQAITITALYEYSSIVTITHNITIDGNKVGTAKTYSYYYKMSKSNAPNGVGYGYVFTADGIYEELYLFSDWTTTNGDCVTITGNTLTLKDISNQTLTDGFEINQNYKSYKATIKVSHNYLTGCTVDGETRNKNYETGSSADFIYHYRVGLLETKNNSDKTFFTDNKFNLFTEKDSKTYYFAQWSLSANSEGLVSVSGENANTVIKDTDLGSVDTITLNAYYDIDYAHISCKYGADNTIFEELTYNYKTDNTSTPFTAPAKDGYEFTYWTIVCNSGEDYLNLFTYTEGDDVGKYTSLETKGDTNTSCSLIYEITLVANYRSIDDDVCTITVNFDYADNVETQIYTFHYKSTGSASGGELYLGNKIEAPTKDGYTFDKWTINSGTDFFAGISGSIINLVSTAPAKTGVETAEITATYIANTSTITVEFRQGADKDLGNLDETKDLPKSYQFHYEVKGTKDNANIYLGDTITAPDIAGYTFVSWTVSGDNNNIIASNVGKILTLTSEKQTTNPGNITVTANYNIDNTSCTITIVGYNHPDDVKKNAKETKEISITFYYKRGEIQGADNNYCLGSTLNADDLNFGFAKTNGLAFAQWELIDKNTGANNSTYFSNVNLTSNTLTFTDSKFETVQDFKIYAHYTYTGEYQATFEIYGRYYENNATSEETLKTTLTFNFADISKGGLAYGTTISGVGLFGDNFASWEVPQLLNGATDWANLWSYVSGTKINEIMTCAEKPDMLQEIYTIKLVANLDVNKANITINFVNKKTNDKIQDGTTYVIYYNGSTRIDNEDSTPVLVAGQTIVADSIENYRFLDWMCAHSAFSELFGFDNGNLKIKTLTGLDMSGIHNVEINAEYWPNEIITIKVVTRYDGVEQNVDETYQFYYSGGNIPAGDGILKEGDKIEAKDIAGMSFSSWNLNSNTLYFEEYVSGNTLTLKDPTNESGNKEITIYKDYISNVLRMQYEHYYQTESGSYVLADEYTSDLKFDYSNTKNVTTFVENGTNHTTKISDGVYSLDKVLSYNSKTYHWNRTEFAGDQLDHIKDNFFTIDSSNEVIKTKVPTGVTGGYTITIQRYYNINELYLTVKSKVGETTNDMELDKDIFTTLVDDGQTNLRYLYNYDGKKTYTFPTNINTETQTYRFLGWTIAKTVGNDNYENLFSITHESGKITKIGLSPTNTGCDGVYGVTLIAEFEIIDNVCVISVDYKDDTSSIDTDNIKSYNFYYDKNGTVKDDNLYLGNSITAPTIKGYRFAYWLIKANEDGYGEEFFSFTKNSEETKYPYSVKTKTLNLATAQPKRIGDLYFTGPQAVSIEAVYVKEKVTITVNYLDNKTEDSIADSKTYYFYYGLNGTSTNEQLYLGATIEAPTIANYGFKEWKLTAGNSIFIQDSATSILQLVSKCPQDITGDYVITLEARYTEQANNIVISYLDSYGNDLSEVDTKGATSYKFFYTQKGLLDTNAYLGSTITAPNKIGYTFTGWEVKGDDQKFFVNSQEGQSFTDAKLVIVSELNKDNYPTANIEIVARYVEDVCNFTIEFVDEDGNKISADETFKYYYHGTVKTDGRTYDNEISKNLIDVKSIAGYNFVEWDTDSSLVQVISKQLYLAKIDNSLSGEYSHKITAKYKAQSSYYITINVDCVHWESEYYAGSADKLNGETSIIYRYYYYTNKLVGMDDNEITGAIVQSANANLTSLGYTFRNWKVMDNIELVSGFDANKMYVLAGGELGTFIDATKVNDIKLTQGTDATGYLTTETIYKTLTMTNANLTDSIKSLLDAQSELSISLVAYYSKDITIKQEEAEEGTSPQTIENIPVNYIVNNTNFGGEIEKEFNYLLSGEATFKFKSEVKLSSKLNDNKLIISKGASYDYQLDKFSIDVGKIKTDSTVLDKNNVASVYNFVTNTQYEQYAPSNYSYDGLSEYESTINAGWAMYVPTPTMYFNSPNIFTHENITDEALLAYIQNYVYGKKWNQSSTDGDTETSLSYAFNLYIQWKGNGYTIAIDTKINGVQNAYYNTTSGSVGTPIYWFDGTPVTDNNYLAEMARRYGKVDGFVITKLEAGTEIFDINGVAMKVGDKISIIYANSHGDFSIGPNITEYTELTVKLDYHASTTNVGTLESIYDVVAENAVDNIFELKNKFKYNQQLKLSEYLKNKFQDPNPLTVKYNSQYYYLAGWTLSNIGFNPENWNNIDTTMYSNLISYLLKKSSPVEFRTNIVNFNGVSTEWWTNKIMSYDNSGFECVYGDSNQTITLHAVWLPFYNINLYKEATVETGNTKTTGEIYYGNTIKESTDKLTINYALTLQKQSIALDYDLRTSYGRTPSTVGYSLSFYTYMLTAYTITDGTYYYGSYNGTNNWNGYSSIFNNFTNVNEKNYTALNVQEMMNLYITKCLAGNRLSNMTVNIYPIVDNATIKIDVVNKNMGTETTTSNTINLVGLYKLNSLTIKNYSVDYLLTGSDKKVKYLNGIDFVNFLDTNASITAGFGENVEADVVLKVENGKQILQLTLNAYYAGDLYFLKIQSKDGFTGSAYNDDSLICATAISLADFNSYKTITLNGKIKVDTNAFTSIPLGFGKVLAINNSNVFYDYTEIYEQCINQVVTDGSNFYLVLAYGEKLYGEDKNTLVGKVTRTDGSILEYYLYNNQAIDTIPVEKTRDDSYDIRFDSRNRRYFRENYASVPDYWEYDNLSTINAVWKKKNYHIDLSVGLLDGVIKYSNNAYLVARVEAAKGTTYYIVNYELDTTSSLYTFYMYTLTESQFNSSNRLYGGWDSLGIAKTQTTRITVDATSTLTIWVYDQSKDTNNNLVGYRLIQVEVKNPNETSTTICPVGVDSTISYTKTQGEAGQEYITTNGYETVMNFTSVDLDNNANIKYQAVLDYIIYSLTAGTDKVAGVINGRNAGGEFSTESYTYDNLKIGSTMRVTFRPKLGYELQKWTLNEQDVSTEYTYFTTVDARFLKQFIYNGLATFPTSYENGQSSQNIGTLYAHSQLLNFDLKINIYDEYDNLLESYILQDNANSILSLQWLGGGSVKDVTVLQVSANKYRVNIVPGTHNGYKCYTFDGKDYAILQLALTGRSREFIRQSYTFPTDNFASSEFTFNTDMLSDIVSFVSGEVISEENRTININLNVVTIFEIKADADTEFEKLVVEGDYNNGTRKLMAGDVTIASADSGSALKNSGLTYYAYNGQTVLLRITADKNYYNGGKIYVDGIDLPYEVKLEEEVELTVDSNKVIKANFTPITINYSVVLKYKEQFYTSSNDAKNPLSYKNLKDNNNSQMLKQFPSISILAPDGNDRTSNIVYGDTLNLEFMDTYFNCLTDGVLKDYSYNIYVNKVRQQLSNDGKYSWTFTGDMSVEIEIVPMSGDVSILTNIQDASTLIAVDSRGRTMEISNGTVVFNLMPGDSLAVYAKDNNGYNYLGVRINEGECVPTLRTSADGAYTGYEKINLISNYDSTKSGKYEIVYDYKAIKAKFIYSVNGEEYTSPDNMPGAGYYTDKDSYTIIDNMSINKPANGGENAGFRFIGYSIGTSNINAILDDGKEQVSIRIKDYMSSLIETKNVNFVNEFELPIYINFIQQFTVQVELEGNDFGQTNVMLTYENGNLIAQATSSQSMPLISRYLDESSFNNDKFSLTVSTKDIQNYYLTLTESKATIESGDDYICQYIDGTQLVYEGKYIFELDRNYLFKLKYMPREYASNMNYYLITDVDKLEGYREDLNCGNLDKLTSDDLINTSQISVSSTTDNTELNNRYGTKNTLTITIEEVYDETRKIYYTDYAIEHLKIDGTIQKLIENVTVDNSGKKTYTYLLTYEVLKDVEIDIVFKRVYGVDTGINK